MNTFIQRLSGTLFIHSMMIMKNTTSMLQSKANKHMTANFAQSCAPVLYTFECTVVSISGNVGVKVLIFSAVKMITFA